MLSIWRILPIIFLFQGMMASEAAEPSSVFANFQKAELAFSKVQDEENFSALVFQWRLMLLYDVLILKKELGELSGHFMRRNHRALYRRFVQLLHEYPALTLAFVKKNAGQARFPFDEALPLLLDAEAYDAFKWAIESARSDQPHAGAATEADWLLSFFVEIKDPVKRFNGLKVLSTLSNNNPFVQGSRAPLLDRAYAMAQTLGLEPLSPSRKKRVIDLLEGVARLVAQVHPEALEVFKKTHLLASSDNALVSRLHKRVVTLCETSDHDLEQLAEALQRLERMTKT